MFRVCVHLTTGEKLGSFRAREFDIDLGKRGEDGLQRYTYTGPEGEEETIYLNPKSVAAIETRPVKEGLSQRFEDPAPGGRNRPLIGWNGGRRDLLAMEDEREGVPLGRRSGGREWPPPRGSEGPDAKSPEQPAW